MSAFRKLKASKQPVAPGDIFGFSFNRTPDRYFFGRVIRNDMRPRTNEDFLLLYFYRHSHTELTDPGSLSLDELATPPIMTGDFPWRKGWFQTVVSRPLRADEVLAKHYFRSAAMVHPYVDSDGNPSEPPPPGALVSCFGLATNIGLEEELLEAYA